VWCTLRLCYSTWGGETNGLRRRFVPEKAWTWVNAELFKTVHLVAVTTDPATSYLDYFLSQLVIVVSVVNYGLIYRLLAMLRNAYSFYGFSSW